MERDPQRQPAVAARATRRCDAWAKAWCSACTGIDCGGLKPYFLNSRADGGAGGADLHRHRRAQRLRAQPSGASAAARLMFALLLFGVLHADAGGAAADEPGAGLAGHRQLDLGPGPGARGVPACPSTTLFFRNYYVGLPDELIKAAMLDGAGFWQIFWRIVLPLSTPDHGGDADLAVHQHLERLPLRRGVLGRRQQADHRGPEQPGQHPQLRSRNTTWTWRRR